MNSVSYQAVGEIGVITVHYPPVNALSLAVRTGLGESLARANADPDIKAILIRCDGKTFIAGADIKELQKGWHLKNPTLGEIQAMLETGKPSIAAIHGTALGGGYELALTCHARIALNDAAIGLPEVKLGLLPGAGGTQRLTRLCGPAAALDIIVSGRQVPASEALQLGAIDAIVTDLDEAALTFARDFAARPAPAPVIARNEAIAGIDPDIFAAARKQAARKSRGAEAPLAIIACIEQACELTPAEGLRFERAEFDGLFGSDQHKALTHYFFAEREARKIPGLPGELAAVRIERAGVIGTGTMGRGIAVVLANAGIEVRLVDTNSDAAKLGMEAIKGIYDGSAARGIQTRDAADAALKRIKLGGYEDLGEVDLVVEAAPEIMELKRTIFARLDASTPPRAILATNTSSLDIDSIAAATARPERVIGAHFFSPAHIMKLLELVRGTTTGPEAIAAMMSLAARLGKTPVLAGNCDGFIGNRMLQYYTGQSEFLMEHGIAPERIDAVAERFGMPMGPVALRDLAGIDVSVLVRKERMKTLPEGERMSPILERMVEAGRFGRKNGKGFYRYEGGERSPAPQAAAIIAGVASDLGIPAREFSDEEIRDRLFMPLVNEGAKELEDGIAIRAGDIDVAWVNGYGFPRWRGGPMFWGQSVGFDKVAELAREFGERYGPRWRPTPLLETMVRDGVATWREAGY
ncbi:3-hydroxyacyl-CoA dehydrogenase NAD-binding domain-containing protein [Maricaulis salignorans]|uniref:3-hydroxyacyl-CoA dehydrogenase n=1 Tax=Maricaulis salignorans TaxID=144026 RepID=A0A1G9LR16_9PROT|nr:3-hydroxyacyl-CoA dehydrogenase NAD-binding domain-containing protein [Maricaulis salignorans]SDL64400.1 3-hydroxyacyl-CoA dehydrogenase [Maricaulis salignorans]